MQRHTLCCQLYLCSTLFFCPSHSSSQAAATWALSGKFWMGRPFEPYQIWAISKWLMEWTSSLDMIKGFSVRCCLKPEGFGLTGCAELHHSTDANESRYGSVSYIRQLNEQNVNLLHVIFVLGMSRVLPLKYITVPRLELAAALCWLKWMLRRQLYRDLKPSVFWTDSQTRLTINFPFTVSNTDFRKYSVSGQVLAETNVSVSRNK